MDEIFSVSIGNRLLGTNNNGHANKSMWLHVIKIQTVRGLNGKRCDQSVVSIAPSEVENLALYPFWFFKLNFQVDRLH